MTRLILIAIVAASALVPIVPNATSTVYAVSAPSGNIAGPKVVILAQGQPYIDYGAKAWLWLGKERVPLPVYTDPWIDTNRPGAYTQYYTAVNPVSGAVKQWTRIIIVE